MNVLVVAQDYIRGFAERLIWAIETHTQHNARGLFKKRSPSRYVGSLQLSRPWLATDREEVDSAVQWADIFHCVHGSTLRTIGRPDMIGKKPTVWQMFTQWDHHHRRMPAWYARTWRDGDERHIRRALVAEGWQRYDLWRRDGIEFTHLPSIFPIHQPEYLPVPVIERRRAVSYAVMNKKDELPAPKGYKETRRALKSFDHDFMIKISFEECLTRKAHSWCGVDEVITPVVHFSAFEYAALGVPCFSQYDDRTVRAIRDVTGCTVLPFNNVCLGELRGGVRWIMEHEDDAMTEKSSWIRSWMEQYYDPAENVQRYLELYDSL